MAPKINYLESELYSLIQSEKEIFQFIEAGSLDGIWYWDLEKPENEWMSPKFWTTLGYDPAEMPHTPSAWQDIIDPEDFKLAGENLAKHLEDPDFPYDQVVRYRHKDGSTVWVRCRGIAIRDEHGKPIRMLGAHNDHTQTKESEQTLQQKIHELDVSGTELQSFLDDANDMIQILDHEAKFKYVNRAWLKVMGYKAKELSSLHLSDILHPESADHCLNKFAELMKSKGSCSLQVSFVNKSGKKVVVDGSISVSETEKGNLIRGIYRDITRSLEIEKELQRVRKLQEETSRMARVGGWEVDLVSNKEYWSDLTREILELEDGFVPSSENWFTFFKEGEHRNKILEASAKLKETGEAFEEEVLAVTAKGKELWVIVKCRLEQIDSLPVRVIGSFQDIDEKKRTNDRLINHRELLLKLSNQVAGVLFQYRIDQQGNHSFPFISKRVQHLFGISREEVYHDADQPFNLIHNEDLRALKQAIKLSSREMSYFQFDMRITARDGKDKWVSLNSSPEKYPDGSLVWSGYMEDVSWRKQTEMNLQEVKEAALEASRVKSEFLANMSHEIRTPLNSVIGFSDLLVKTNLDDNQQQYMNAVHISANSLLDLINDILDFSKIEAGKLELAPEKTDLWALVEQVSDIVKQKVQEKNVELLLNISSEVPRYAWVDPIRIRQILVNLMGNALKFTENGEIEIILKRKGNKSDAASTIEFSVRDTGIGIQPEKQKQIFQAFSQEDASTTRKYGGTGLGLSISNQLLKLMGSQLELESEPGVGSRFFFKVTLKTEMYHPHDWKELRDIKQVLVIDDHAKNLEIIREMLALENIKCDVAKNGPEGLGKLEHKEYDVLIVDYYMPYMDGLQVIEEVRNTLKKSAADLAVMLLHSSADDKTIYEGCRKLAVDKIISKPISYKQLFTALSRLRNDQGVKEVSSAASNSQVCTEEKVKILIADDNKVNMLLARTMLQKLMPNATLLEAEDGLKAVDQFLQERPDIILMDIQMPNMSGYEASKQIRSSGKAYQPIIIALTAGTVKGEKERCINAGMNDYLSKPMLLQSLRDKLTAWMPGLKKPDDQKSEPAENDELHFQLDSLIEDLNHDDVVLQQLLTDFKTQVHDALLLFDRYHQKGDLHELRSLGHKLKGSAKSLKMAKLSDLSAKLENMALQHTDINELKKICTEVEEEVHLLLKMMEPLTPDMEP